MMDMDAYRGTWEEVQRETFECGLDDEWEAVEEKWRETWEEKRREQFEDEIEEDWESEVERLAEELEEVEA